MLSAPVIRYLVALNSLNKEGGIWCVDIAEILSLSKPTVHAMIEALAEKGVVEKERYGMVFLTEEV
jgi:Mn-dependent DtxR family transcriptional regulator